MGIVFADMTMSLDGYIAGPNHSAENPLGDGGLALHEWIFALKGWREPHGLGGGIEGPESDRVFESFGSVGAFVMGRSMFDTGEAPWGDEPPFHKPVFVATHNPRDREVKAGGTSFEFVTEGIDVAIARAREAAGELDEIEIHIVPLLLGSGGRLFKDLPLQGLGFELLEQHPGTQATHIRYRITH